MEQLRLDPGLTPRRRLWVVLRYLCWTVMLVLVAIRFRHLYSEFLFATKVGRSAWSPHKELYYDGLLGDHSNKFMLPMIDMEQRFDIGVTVWVRKTEEEEAVHRREHDVPDDEDDVPLETPLYADVPLKGLRMADKGVSTVVSFRVPTARFHGRNLTSLDLRGSFVVIPTSPSPVDHVADYVNYLQPVQRSGLPWVKYWPERPTEFPLGSNNTRGPSPRERVIDTMSAQVPLVAFYETEDPCHGSGRTLRGFNAPNALFLNESAPSNRHPYIITRTQLRLVDETHPFNATAVALNAATLSLATCGRGQNNRNKPLRRAWCYNAPQRHYKTYGHWETIYSLQYDDKDSGAMIRKENRYSPYMDTMLYGYTAKDLIRMPVTRENCSLPEGTAEFDTHTRSKADKEFMDITWHISFSGRSSLKAALADELAKEPLPLDAYVVETRNGTVSVGPGIQIGQEMWQGVLGHQHNPAAHPRRRMALHVLSMLLRPLFPLLEAHYWLTRSSTAGITRTAARINAAVRLACDAAVIVRRGRGIYTLMAVAVYGINWLKDVAMAGVLWTLGRHARWRWVPVLRGRTLSHRERASERLDARTLVGAKYALFGLLLAAYVVVRPWSLFVVSPRPVHPDGQTSFNWGHVELALTMSANLTFNILQALLNLRTRTFAGAHRVYPLLRVLYHATDWAPLVPSIVGPTQVHGAVRLDSAIDFVVWCVLTAQAAAYPVVEQNMVDEDEE